MNDPANFALLTSLLDDEDRIDDGTHDTISDERLYAALTIGPGFTDEESLLLWKSPIAYQSYRLVRETIATDIRDRCRSQHIKTSLELRAAQGGGSVSYSKPGQDFIVDILRSPFDDRWLIAVRMNETLRSIIPPMTHVTLVDKSGHEFLQGQPDSQGQVLVEWKGERPPREVLDGKKVFLKFD